MNDLVISLQPGESPDLSYQHFNALLDALGCPVTNERPSIYSSILTRGGIHPSVFLAFWLIESNLGKEGIQAQYNTRNPGNVRTPEIPNLASGVVNTPKRNFVTYDTWAKGTEDWVARLKGPKYLGRGLATIRQILPVYAPKSDSNDPVIYGDKVLTLIDTWRKAVVSKPAITVYHTATKFGGYSGTRQRRLIVSHVTGVAKDRLSDHGSLSWLHDEIAGSPSVNFLIARSGQIFEIVDPYGEAPWTNGIDYSIYPRGKNPNMANPVIAEFTNARISPNQYCLTIEHESDSGQNLTAAQWQATLNLQAWLCQTFHITPDATHLIGHNQIDSIDRPYCPGWTDAQWNSLRTNIKALLQPTPVIVDPGFPGALQPDGRTVINGVDFGGEAVCVEEITARVRNDKGERFERTWVGHQLKEWLDR